MVGGRSHGASTARVGWNGSVPWSGSAQCTGCCHGSWPGGAGPIYCCCACQGNMFHAAFSSDASSRLNPVQGRVSRTAHGTGSNHQGQGFGHHSRSGHLGRFGCFRSFRPSPSILAILVVSVILVISSTLAIALPWRPVGAIGVRWNGSARATSAQKAPSASSTSRTSCSAMISSRRIASVATVQTQT